ncbi:hypothetical protein OHC33_004754 [Knufia fluminis]|uniref:Uncharacterized protein n=1 Tax=Knufia fluminis TaxID=191047 RepID=A0AAN8EUS0_9EURO|nr:hypothetical protein OHC33_004754 [Knufia fluminis]
MATPAVTPVAPVPRIALPNPHIRKPSLSAVVAQQDTVRNNSQERGPVPSIPTEHQHKRSGSSEMEIGQAVTSYSPIDATYTPLSATKKYTPPPPPRSKHSSPQTSSDSGYHSGGADSARSPVAYRSMFPTYDPSKSLNQQNYYPQRPVAAQMHSSPGRLYRPSYTPSLMTPIDRALGPPSAPPSVFNFPLDTLTPRLSTARELLELWEATHGMEPSPKIRSYDLELARTEEANFNLGSDPSLPFYSLITYDTNEIALTKVNPRKSTIKCEVSINSIEAASRRQPPNDGLIAFIFPKMAAMMAINQSTALAKEHGLAPTHRDEVQAAAVKRAASQEACKLRWNANAQHYELEHPAAGRRQRGPDFAKSPESARGTPMLGARPVLDIHVSKQMGRILPIITVANPRESDIQSASEPTIPGIRMSTIPQSEHDNALLTLDFNTRIMHINANQILEHVPSLFAIDSIVSAIMTVAIADEVTNPIMAAMELWQPKPTPTIARSAYAGSVYGGSVAGKSTAGSVFYATLAEREEAEAEAKELAVIHERDIKNKERRKEKQHNKWFGRKKGKEPKNKTKKVVVKEFDLEKLGHYQSGERKGQELPGVVRLMLSVMIGGLKSIVWILTTIVHFFAWILVVLTRGVTSEKF